MQISFRESFGAKPQVFDFSAPGLLDWIEQWSVLRAVRQDQIPLWAPVAFGDSFAERDLRGGICAVVLDADDLDPAQSALLIDAAKRFCDHGLAHATWSDTPKCRSVRVILPLAPQYVINGWPEFYTGIAARFARAANCSAHRGRGGIDLSCANPGRTFYLPATKSTEHGLIAPQIWRW